jgi:3-hydroxyisobutyrate dehydrogenase-like beta-hydroxyacid dehydrogenase
MAAADGGGEDVQVAVLGTGIMGSAMARNLAAAGLRTAVWDRSPSAAAPLSDAGALVAASPAEAVRHARVVITMLPTAEVVNSVVFAGGVVQAFAEGAVWAQMGTIGVTATTEAIEGGPLDAPIADAKLHKMEQGDFAPEFPLQWAVKDVDLAIEAAGGDTLPLLVALSRQWHAAVDAGHGREDVSAARLALGGHQ